MIHSAWRPWSAFVTGVFCRDESMPENNETLDMSQRFVVLKLQARVLNIE